ncbi:MAG: DUF6702 family protein [Thermonemataceae bacterium]|nr:DUF6702 family protein [Thermonemataceae bacterium]
MYYWAFLFWLNVLGEPQHDFHSSLATLQYNAKAKAFQVTLKLFADDTELALSKFAGKTYLLGAIGKNRNPDEILRAYLESKFLLKTRHKKLPIRYIGKETDTEGVTVYFEIPTEARSQEYTLENTIMLELFKDQTNIVSISKNNQTRSFQFDIEKTTFNCKL